MWEPNVIVDRPSLERSGRTPCLRSIRPSSSGSTTDILRPTCHRHGGRCPDRPPTDHRSPASSRCRRRDPGVADRHGRICVGRRQAGRRPGRRHDHRHHRAVDPRKPTALRHVTHSRTGCHAGRRGADTMPPRPTTIQRTRPGSRSRPMGVGVPAGSTRTTRIQRTLASSLPNGRPMTASPSAHTSFATTARRCTRRSVPSKVGPRPAGATPPAICASAWPRRPRSTSLGALVSRTQRWAGGHHFSTGLHRGCADVRGRRSGGRGCGLESPSRRLRGPPIRRRRRTEWHC